HDAAAQAGALWLAGAGPADAVVLDHQPHHFAVAAHRHPYFAWLAVGIGIFDRIGDQFGDDDAQRGHLFGGHGEALHLHPYAGRAVFGLHGVFEFADQPVEIIGDLHPAGIVGGVEMAVDA